MKIGRPEPEPAVQNTGESLPGVHPEAPAQQACRFAVLDSRTFFTTPYRLEWLIKRVLVKGQPAVLGGPKKA